MPRTPRGKPPPTSSRREPKNGLRCLNKELELYPALCVLQRLKAQHQEGDGTGGVGQCLANTVKPRRCRNPCQLSESEYHAALESLQQLNSNFRGRPGDFQEILSDICRKRIFCGVHRLRVQELINLHGQDHGIAASSSAASLQINNYPLVTPANYERYDNSTSYPSSARILHDQLERTLETGFKHPKNEPLEGYIYADSSTKNSIFLKIGYTTKDPDVRANEIGDRCLPGGTPVYVSEKVRFPRRIESLVHIELKSRRYKRRDCPCGKKEHKEFFWMTKEEAGAILGVMVQRWNKWIRNEEPYQLKRTGNRASQWNFIYAKEQSPERILREAIAGRDIFRREKRSSTMAIALSQNEVSARHEGSDLEDPDDVVLIEEQASIVVAEQTLPRTAAMRESSSPEPDDTFNTSSTSLETDTTSLSVLEGSHTTRFSGIALGDSSPSPMMAPSLPPGRSRLRNPALPLSVSSAQLGVQTRVLESDLSEVRSITPATIGHESVLLGGSQESLTIMVLEKVLARLKNPSLSTDPMPDLTLTIRVKGGSLETNFNESMNMSFSEV